jgi:hypothetical protein
MTGIQLNPGERLVAIDGVPVNGNGAAIQQQNGVVQQNGAVRQVTPASARTAAPAGSNNIVGTLTHSNLPFSHSPGSSALEKANYERQRNGQRPLIPDPQLEALALQKATIAAQRGHKNHVGGTLGGARCEGVGHTHGRFLSCCLDEPGTYGGAAMVQGRDGWYCCLLVR